jgi:hypothetical protein
MEFNNTFFEKVYKAHLKDYVSVPTELQTRLRYIQNMEEYQLDEIIENINTILISYINNEIKDAYQKIYHRDMLYDVRDDTSGYYRDVLTGLISRS